MIDTSGKVTGIRLTAGQLEKHVHSRARDSGNVSFREPPDRRNLAGELTYRQVLRCLQEGRMFGKPVRDEHGNWRFFMRRHSAGWTVTVEAAAVCVGARIDNIVVLSVDTE